MTRSVHHFGTFDVDNYGDLLFPKILEWRLGGVLVEHISPTDQMSVFLETAPSRIRAANAPLMTVSGGGNIFRFNSSSLDIYKNCRDTAYPKLLIDPCTSATIHSVPYVINSPSIASTSLNFLETLLLKHVLNAADYIAFRDEQSVQLASRITKNLVHLVPDTAFDVSRMWPELRNDLPGRSDYVVFHVNDRYGGTATQIAQEIDRFISGAGLKVVLLPIGPCHRDLEFAHLVQSHTSGDCEVYGQLSIYDFAQLIAQAALYIGSSMHGFITASSYRVPCALVLGDSYMHKFDGVLHALQLERSVVFSSWSEAITRVGSLDAVRPDALDRVFERLDDHWSSISSLIDRKSAHSTARGYPAWALYLLVAFSQLPRITKRVVWGICTDLYSNIRRS